MRVADLAEPPAATRLQWFGQTDRGKVRKSNEDSFLALQFDARETHHLGKFGEASIGAMDLAFAVSDGMGGAMAGEFASRITVDKIIRLLPRSYRQSAAGLQPGLADVLEELFDQIHKAITYLGESDPDCAGMGATLSMCWFTPQWMYFAHAGDSRIYYLPAAEGGIKQLSHDDTHVGWLFRNGKINEREARNHPRRTALQKALGAGHQFVDPQVGSVAYLPGDIFLLCTDGLVDGLYDQQLLERLRPPDPAGGNPAARLVTDAVHTAGKDNTTALVIQAL